MNNEMRRMGSRQRQPLLSRKAVAVAVAASMAAGSAVAVPAAASASTKGTTITMAASMSYVFDSTALAAKFYGNVKKEFEQQHPGDKVNFVSLPGSYNDIVTKLSLLYRSPSTAPDVAQFGVAQVGLFASAGYLAPLNSYLRNASWWHGFPASIQSEGILQKKVYAVNQGENTSGMVYNAKLFKKAHIPVPWHPKNFASIIATAKKLKAALPGVIPLWLYSGTSTGAAGLLQGGLNNFILGTSKPTIFDSSTHKWVVDSPGIRQALGLWQQTYANGLGAPETDLFSPGAGTTPMTLFAKGKLAMAAGSNYFMGMWTKTIAAPYWKGAAQTMAAAPIPTSYGQAPGMASTLSGWDFGIAKSSPHKQLAFDLISLMENQANSVNAANWAGWIPPNRANWNVPSYTKFAPYNGLFAKVAPAATITPAGSGFTAWAQGMGEATGYLVQNPKASVAQAVQVAKTYITEQLGPSSVETLK